MTEIISRLSTALADRYKIERELGAGGMATVYLAEDLKHHRKVAVKVLRPELSAILGGERFLQEIELTANLQHPNILPLYDSGEADTFLYYVMPYVEGETLRDKLDREKQVTVEESVAIAKAVAAALQYAHERGVVHRDIKPENILLQAGQALVADFGIALAVSQAGGTRLTETGLSLGTPHYVSPEQATGDRELDARTDVYSLGAVTYEMLTGDPPHTGNTMQAIVAKVLTEDPSPITRTRQMVPPNVDAAVQRALAKSPADRFKSASDYAAALTNLSYTLPRAAVTLPEQTTGRRAWATPVAVLMTLAAIVATGAALWGWTRSVPKPVARFALALPEAEALRTVDFGLRVAISPDGSRIVYVGPAEGNVQLWVRERDQLNARPLPGTEGGRNPFFSPDGEQVGFFTENPWTLKVTSLGGAPPITLTDSLIGSGGAAWGTDGYLYFDTDRGGLQRMPASGGPRQTAAPLDTARGEIGVAWPEALPNGKGVLFRIRGAGQELNEYDIAVVNVETGERKTLVRGLVARYAASGHLVFATANGNLLAAPFDQDKLEMTGSPTPLLEGLGVGPRGGVDFQFSATGTLVYATGSAAGAADLVWVNRQGTAELVDPEWEGNRSVQSVALSPDGTRLAASLIAAAGAGEHIWVKQLDTGPASRITFEGAANFRPAWTSDGRSVLFLSDRGQMQAGALYKKRADGTGPAEFLATHELELSEGVQSPDGRWLITRTSTSVRGSGDIMALQIGVDTALVPLLATRFGEVTPALSPDGRWLAYASNESGRREIYVRPFPNVDEARWQVSTNGGIEPVWAHSGQELFYFNFNDELVTAQVQTTPSFMIGDQRALFSAVTYGRSGVHQSYAVSPDDRRFIMMRIQGSKDSGLVVVQNFFEELKARVGE